MSAKGVKRCGYCGDEYDDEENPIGACRHHPQFYFPYDIDKEGIHDKGWQCCGAEDPRQPGCVVTAHRHDVRKVHRRNSIAYDFVDIDFEADRRREALLADRRARREAIAAEPRFRAARDELAALRGRPIAELIALTGEPEKRFNCINGVSGFVHSAHRLFFSYAGVRWLADTDYRRAPGPELEAFNLDRLDWFVDEAEEKEYRANMILDLTGD